MIGFEPALQALDLLDEAPGTLLVGPQRPVGHLLLELSKPAGLALDVKENPGGPGAGGRIR
jgi:hypothetical protein